MTIIKLALIQKTLDQ